ncbi:hypothetical protein PAEPH01_1001 [Pancytospora epiphaga]|nr:hypothetical protein PAEPH01_1001 [Pancytospora epiphaga]
MNRRFRNLGLKLFGSQKRQVLAGIIVAVFTIAAYRLLSVWRTFCVIRSTMPEILHFKYDDSEAPGVFNLRVEYPKVRSPLKVDFVGIGGRVVVGDNCKELVGFDLDDISIGKKDPLLIDVGLSISKLIAQGCLGIARCESLRVEMSCVICTRLCYIPMFFHKQFVYDQGVSTDSSDPIDFAKYVDLASVAVRDRTNSPAFKNSNRMGIDVYIDKLKLFEILRDRFAMFRSTDIETNIGKCRLYTNLGFVSEFGFRECEFSGGVKRFLQVSLVVDPDSSELGSWIVDSARNGYPSMALTGIECENYRNYSPEKPLLDTKWLFEKKKKKGVDKDKGPSILTGVRIDQKLTRDEFVLTVSADYYSALRRMFSIFKFVLPRGSSSSTSIVFNVVTGKGVALRASLEIEPFVLEDQESQRESFLMPFSQGAYDGDSGIESGSESSSEVAGEEVTVSFPRVVSPLCGREVLFVVKFSSIKVHELLMLYKRPYVAVNIKGGWIFRMLNRLNILINEDFGVFLVSSRGSAFMIYKGNASKVMKPKGEGERTVGDYTMSHDIRNVGDSHRSIRCVSTMDLTADEVGKDEELVRIVIPNLGIKCHFSRGRLECDASESQIFYSISSGKIIGKVRLVSVFSPSAKRLLVAYDKKDVVFGVFSVDASVETKIPGSEKISLSEIEEASKLPSRRALSNGSSDERLEIQKLESSDVRNLRWGYIGSCVRSKVVDYFKENGLSAEAVSNRFKDAAADKDKGVSSIPFGVVPVHLELCDVGEDVDRLKFRLRSSCDKETGEFREEDEFAAFLKRNGVVKCPIFSCIKHEIACPSVHLILGGENIQSFNFSGTQAGGKNAEEKNRDKKKVVGKGKKRLLRKSKYRMRSFKKSKCKRAASAPGMIGEKGILDVGPTLRDADVSRSDDKCHFVSHNDWILSVRRQDRILMPDPKYTHGREVPVFDDFILETPADAGLVSLSVVKPSVTVSQMDGLIFVSLPEEVYAHVGFDNLSYVQRLIDDKASFKTFNENDTISVIAALALNYLVLRSDSDGKEGKEAGKRLSGSHMCVSSDLNFSSSNGVEVGELDLFVCMPKVLLRAADYVIFDDLDDFSTELRFWKEGSKQVFSMKFLVERQELLQEDLETYKKSSCDGKEILAKYRENSEPLIEFAKRQNLLVENLSPVDDESEGNEVFVEEEPSVLFSSFDFYKKYRFSFSVAFRKEKVVPPSPKKEKEKEKEKEEEVVFSPITAAAVSFNSRSLESINREFKHERLFSLLDSVLFKDDASVLSRLVGNGRIRSILNPHYSCREDSANRESFASVRNSVGGLPLLGLDVKELKNIDSNNIQATLDIFSEDLDLLAERKLSTFFRSLPASCGVPEKVFFTMSARAPSIFSLNVLDAPVLGFVSPVATLEAVYNMAYLNADSIRDEKKEDIMRALVHTLFTEGFLKMKDGELVKGIPAVSISGTTKAVIIGTANVGDNKIRNSNSEESDVTYVDALEFQSKQQSKQASAKVGDDEIRKSNSEETNDPYETCETGEDALEVQSKQASAKVGKVPSEENQVSLLGEENKDPTAMRSSVLGLGHLDVRSISGTMVLEWLTAQWGKAKESISNLPSTIFNSAVEGLRKSSQNIESFIGLLKGLNLKKCENDRPRVRSCSLESSEEILDTKTFKMKKHILKTILAGMGVDFPSRLLALFDFVEFSEDNKDSKFRYREELWGKDEFISMYFEQKLLLSNLIVNSQLDGNKSTETEAEVEVEAQRGKRVRSPISVTFFIHASASHLLTASSKPKNSSSEPKFNHITDPQNDICILGDDKDKEGHVNSKSLEGDINKLIEKMMKLGIVFGENILKISSIDDIRPAITSESFRDIAKELSKCEELVVNSPVYKNEPNTGCLNLMLTCIKYLSTAFAHIGGSLGDYTTSVENIDEAIEDMTAALTPKVNGKGAGIVKFAVKYGLITSKIFSWSKLLEILLKQEDEHTFTLLFTFYNAFILGRMAKGFNDGEPLGDTFKFYKPSIVHLLDSWIPYIFSSTQLRHALPVPLAVRYVGDHTLCLDLRLPVRFYMANRKAISFSMLIGGRAMFIFRVEGFATSAVASANGFGTTISLACFQTPLGPLISAPTGFDDTVWNIESTKLSKDEYSVVLITRFKYGHPVKLVHDVAALSCRLFTRLFPVLNAIGIHRIFFTDYDSFDIRRYYSFGITLSDTRDPFDLVKDVTGLLFIDRNECSHAEYKASLPSESVIQIYKKYEPRIFASKNGWATKLSAISVSKYISEINDIAYNKVSGLVPTPVKVVAVGVKDVAVGIYTITKATASIPVAIAKFVYRGSVAVVKYAFGGPVAVAEPALSEPVAVAEPALSEPVAVAEPALSGPVADMKSALSGPVADMKSALSESVADIKSVASGPAAFIKSVANFIAKEIIGKAVGKVIRVFGNVWSGFYYE